MLRAIMVCVDYSDYLALTLPCNRHHFDEVMVVTVERDTATIDVCQQCDAKVFTTELFYTDGADFNKWRALEAGLDSYGRQGWLCIMDADVIWPGLIPPLDLKPGHLYSPLRHMMRGLIKEIPPEEKWKRYPIHRNINEWAGYTQIFHATDPALGPPPWHQVDWRHAGGADSFFQRRWDPSLKVRTPWNVLHLGDDGANWCGRATPMLDGNTLEESRHRQAQLQAYFKQRRRTGNFNHERLP